MRHIVIASHHRMASGLADTLAFVAGVPNVHALDAYMDGTDEIETQVAELMDGFDDGDEVLVFTDMLGGSVTQRFAPYANEHVHVICGMSLPLVLEIALGHPDPLAADEIHDAIDSARQGMLYVNEHMANDLDDDE